jgi:hypothetical protein
MYPIGNKPGVRRLITLQDLPPISTATFGNAQVVRVSYRGSGRSR